MGGSRRRADEFLQAYPQAYAGFFESFKPPLVRLVFIYTVYRLTNFRNFNSIKINVVSGACRMQTAL